MLVTGLALAYRYLSPNDESALATFNRWLNQRALGSATGVANATATAPTSNASNIEHERAVIASAACRKSRARVAGGGSVGPADVEGWQVELVLLRRGPHIDLSEGAELAPFVRRTPGGAVGKLVWARAAR